MRVSVRVRAMGYAGLATPKQHADCIAYFMEEVLPLSGRVLAPADDACTAVALGIRHIPTDGGEIELDDTSRLLLRVAPVVFLEFSAEINVNAADALRDTYRSKKHKTAALKRLAKGRLEEAISTLSLAIAIAHPGELKLGALPFESNGIQLQSAVHWGDLGRGKHIAEEIGWPTARTLTVEQVLDWLDQLPGWRDGIGRANVGRSVAALSQALAAEGAQPSAVALIWAMVGLEALFCRRPDGLKSQLSTNVQLLLGGWSSHKKRFGNAYNYRSKFLHGGVDVPFAHRGREKDEEAWRFMWQSDEEAGLAMVTLLVSIQELIIRGWHKLDFESSIAAPQDI